MGHLNYTKISIRNRMDIFDWGYWIRLNYSVSN